MNKKRAANAKTVVPPTKASIKKKLAETKEDESENDEEPAENSDDESSKEEGDEDSESDEEEEEEGENDVDDIAVDLYDDEGNVLETNDDEKPSATTPPVAPKPDAAKMQELRLQLASRIQQLREKRKAPGTSVKGAHKDREAALEARKEKQRIQKEKRELKRKREEKEEVEEESSDEELQDEVSDDEGNVMFSTVVFKDGDKASADLSELKKKKIRKGPRDILGQLKHIEAKKAKLQDMDAEKRKSIETKTKWSKVLALAEGEKVRDDEKMLKKSLKKQTKQKKKSARIWKEREQTVTDNIAAKQKKREENIALKRERNKLTSKKAKKKAGLIKAKPASNKFKRHKKK